MRGEKMWRNRFLNGKQYDHGVFRLQVKRMSCYNKAAVCEPKITRQVRAMAKKAGMEMAGMENRMKSRDSYLQKIQRKYGPGCQDYEVKDILRYTYTASAEELTKKTLKAMELYWKSGYDTVEIKNYWLDRQSPYKGINTTLRSPDGQIFELQYHTPESFSIKNGKMHELYEMQRPIKDLSSKEYQELWNQMLQISNSIKQPKDIEKVKPWE
ncbi:hypothetical protein [Lacrimispora saccharolytica]|uniref:Uncharacterized protein n=1 Tax=Lacrimispora saccharolytica (strain ATCC 35040 / DSM 2544 / NRCC 2533 / WM1) TaxID=610130 RepID=D9RAF9_LACSW|nr:hypothetical protein [Lacrimispora saccharolytica]ADL04237.1 conserved hypothetical protein [[Clostridium] saccharolyticum WM1]QRV21482.1 hypothetical protein I6K70_08560 [Lacrimispora saccharolytica]